MNIYFVGSISGRDQFQEEYSQIVKTLEGEGHEVSENTLEPTVDYVFGLSQKDKADFYKKVLSSIREADIVVAEVSYSSLGVGHEISIALEKGKPVVALHKGSHAVHLLEGMDTDKLILVEYDLATLKEAISSALDFAKETNDTRFNFFISPRHSNYLDWIARNKRIPRSVYLRNLIKKDMAKNKEFFAS